MTITVKGEPQPTPENLEIRSLGHRRLAELTKIFQLAASFFFRDPLR